VSYAVTAAVVRGYAGTESAFRVLAILADFANDQGIAWPSVKTIADLASLTPRQARAHLSTLQREGWITLCGTRKGGREYSSQAGRSTRWRINVDRLTARSRPANPDADVPVSAPDNPEARFRLDDQETRKSSVVKAEVSRRQGGSPASLRRKPTSAEAVRTYQESVRNHRAEPERVRQPAAAPPEINHKAETTTPPDDPGNPREDDPMDDQDDGRIPAPDHIRKQLAAFGRRHAMPTTTRPAPTRAHADDDDPSQAASVQPSKAQARKEAASRERQAEAVARLTARRATP
jgi:hypothetical protein